MSASAQPSLWEQYVAPVGDSELHAKLVQIAREMLRTTPHGVIVGEVILEAERRGISCVAPPMEDKQKAQRKTSWFARVMRDAGGVATADVRRSPVPRHHGNRHSVYRRREVNP